MASWLVFVATADGSFYADKLYPSDTRRHGPLFVTADTAEEARDAALKGGAPSSRRAHTAFAVEVDGPLHRWRIHPVAPEWGHEEVIG